MDPQGFKKSGAKWSKLISDFAGWLALTVLVGSSCIWALAGGGLLVGCWDHDFYTTKHVFFCFEEMTWCVFWDNFFCKKWIHVAIN